MNDIVASVAVILLATMLVVMLTSLSRSRREQRYLLGALAMHLAFAFALRIIMENVLGANDVRAYVAAQRMLRPLLQDRPAYASFEILKMILQLPNEIPIDRGSTTSMLGVAALGLWAFDDSVYGLFLFCSVLGFFGKWGIYASLRDELKLPDPRALLACCLMIPSCVFWTAGLVKECFAIFGLGALVRGTQLVLRRFHPGGVLLIPFGFILIGAFKPFLLFAFVVAVGIWIFVEKVRNVPAFGPFVFVFAAGFAVVGLVVLGTLYEEFAVEKLGDAVAGYQGNAQEAEGGSNYLLVNPEKRSVGYQIGYAPLALLTVLLRPLPFEVHNAQAAIASAELAFLNVLLVRSLYRMGIVSAWRRVLKHPVLMFSLTFLLAAGTGVGLATGNFGTLSRYRTPVLPFYAVLVVVGLGQLAAKAPNSKMRSAAVRRTVASMTTKPSTPAKVGAFTLPPHLRGRR